MGARHDDNHFSTQIVVCSTIHTDTTSCIWLGICAEIIVQYAKTLCCLLPALALISGTALDDQRIDLVLRSGLEARFGL